MALLAAEFNPCDHHSPLTGQAPNFCNCPVSKECLVNIKYTLNKPKYASLWIMLTVSTEFPASVIAKSPTPLRRWWRKVSFRCGRKTLGKTQIGTANARLQSRIRTGVTEVGGMVETTEPTGMLILKGVGVVSTFRLKYTNWYHLWNSFDCIDTS